MNPPVLRFLFGHSVRCLTLLACAAPVWGAQPAPPSGSPRPSASPSKILVPQLNAYVVETREKVADRNRANVSADDKQGVSMDDLDAKVRGGDVHAAIAKADRVRKDLGKVTTASGGAMVEALINQGAGAGIPEALRAKAELAWDRGDAAAALTNLKAASQRGSARADFVLAKFKAQKPEWSAVKEAPIVLLQGAADRGDAEAALQYGLALDRGLWRFDATHAIRCAKAGDKAEEWMERASALGRADASLWLGLRYMQQAEGLVDIRRQKALEHFMAARKAGVGLIEPGSGKTFDELEVAGAIEPGLLSELKRREAREKSDVSQSRSVSPKNPKSVGDVGTAEVRRIDHHVMEIIGDPAGATPVYNLLGLSPYKDVTTEYAVKSVAGDQLVVDAVPSVDDVTGYSVELILKDRQVLSIPVKEVDATRRRLWIASALPEKLPAAVRYRLVRPHTLFSTFGEDNAAGLRPGKGATTADEVIFYDARSKRRRQCFFHGDRLEWTDSATGKKVADIEFVPGAAIAVKRTEAVSVVLQARGALPREAFDVTPARGTNLVSLRKNALGEAVTGNLRNAAVQAASELSVLTPNNQHNGWQVERNRDRYAWWSLLGISAAARVHVVGDSAGVLINP